MAENIIPQKPPAAKKNADKTVAVSSGNFDPG